MVFSRLFPWLHTCSTRSRPFSLWNNPIWPINRSQISGVVDYHYGNQCSLRWPSSVRLQRIIKETKVLLPTLYLGSHLSSVMVQVKQTILDKWMPTIGFLDLSGLHFLETWPHSTKIFLHPMIFWSYIS